MKVINNKRGDFMENYSFLLYVFCIIIIFLIGKFFIVPIKKLIKLCVNSAIGAVLIYVIGSVILLYAAALAGFMLKDFIWNC